MNRILIFVVVGALVLGLAAAAKKKGQKPHKDGNSNRNRGGNGNPDPTTTEAPGELTWGECVPRKGDCGKGVKTGSCSGEGCATKTAACRVKCPTAVDETATVVEGEGEEASTVAPHRGGGRGKGGKPGKRGGRVHGKGDKGKRGGRKPGKPETGGKQNKPHKGICKYERATVSECNPATGRQNKTRVLKSGDRSECEDVMVSTFTCNKKTIRKENRRCNYTFGEFSECNETTNLRYRVDTLTDPSQVSEQCRLERTVVERCSRKDCVYNWEESECNAETNVLTITGSLVDVESAPSHCEAAVSKELACKIGKDRCRFGEWREYGECTNGLMTRTREVLKGGHGCHRLTKEHIDC